MFVVLSKMLDLLLAPLTWALVLVVLGLVLRRRTRLATGLGVGGVVLLWVFSAQPVANALTRIGESAAGSTYRPEATYDAVILLGGALDPEATEEHGTPQYSGAAERVLATFELLREGKASEVLITGGSLDPGPGAVVEALVERDQLIRWGIAPERIIVEGNSRNTRENAVNSGPLIARHNWRTLLLVTSALHLPRALGCFRAVGLSPDALPVDFHGYDPKRHTGSILPRASALAQSTDVLRELAGRIVYRVLGYAR